MRELDRIAVEETGPNLWQMMENAGRSLAEFLICQEGADWRAARAPGLRVALRVSLVDRPARKGPRRKGKGSDFEYA